MDRQLNDWKFGVDRLWSAPSFDYGEAARLAGEIARLGTDATLRQAASQALPGLRGASRRTAGRGTAELSRRRFGAVHDILHRLTAPQFGKRGAVAGTLSPEQHYRQMLGLPPGGRLAGAEIHRAWKHAAKTAHPDGGGDERQFQDLCAARDALMRVR